MRPLVSSVLRTAKPGTDLSIYGWVQSVRRMKNVAFADISDGSSPLPMNVVFDDPKASETLTTGSCVRVDGKVVESPGKQRVELQAKDLSIFGAADSSYPLQKKYHSREFLRQLPHLRWKTRQAAQVLRYRSWALSQLQQFFTSHDVVQVNSPLITSSDCEGAGEVFTLAQGDEFFGKPAYLSVSSQLHLEVFAAALSRVWNLTPAFRAEASDTNRHLSEFWMVEAELAFLDGLSDLTQFCEEMTKAAVPSGQIAEDLLLSKREKLDRENLESRWNTLQRPWTTVTYTEAVDLLNKSKKTDSLEWGQDLPSEHEKLLANKLVGGVTVVTDYPESIKPFYMKKSGPQTVAAFDVLIPEVGEIVGGSIREDDYEELKGRLKRFGMSVESMNWYLDLRKFGSFPHGGYGLGLERLVMYACGLSNIRDAAGFVRGYGSLPC